MEDRLLVTASPHIRDHSTTRGLMGNVVIALLPAVLASALIFGARALLLVVVTTFACVAFEYIYERLLHKPNTAGDLSAVVTGIILALNMPVGMPLWIAVVGAFVAIVITKQLFGGLGYNFANPALVACNSFCSLRISSCEKKYCEVASVSCWVWGPCRCRAA